MVVERQVLSILHADVKLNESHIKKRININFKYLVYPKILMNFQNSTAKGPFLKTAKNQCQVQKLADYNHR